MSTLKKIMKVSLVFLVMVAMFSSCKKDQLTNPDTTEITTPNNGTTTPGNFLQVLNDGSESNTVDSLEECFQITFPITINIPGAASQDVNSEEEMWTLIEEWFEQVGDDLDEYPTIEFPIEVTMADGSTQSVADDEALCDLYHECYGDDDGDYGDDDGDYDDDDFEDCFEFVYPITVELENGNTVAINSEEEWETLFDSTGNYEYFEIVYPLSIQLEDGTIQNIENEEGMEAVFEDCYGDDWGDAGDCDSTDIGELCFEFVYPLSMSFPDGSTLSVNNEEEMYTAIEAYYEANPSSNEDPELVFPVDVILEDGTQQTINNEEELEELFEECFGDGFGLKNPSVAEGMSRIDRSTQK